MIGLIISILFLTSSGEKNSQLDSYLKQKLSDFTKYEYKVVSLPSYVESINDKRISISSDREFKINYGFAYVPVDIKLTEENVSQSIITLKINLYDEVFTSVRKIKRGEIISQSDFAVSEKEITHLKNGAVKITSLLNNRQACTNIVENAILQENMIEKLPDVKAGDKVFAYSSVGAVTVTFPVLIREDGRIGETVRVVRDDKLIFRAVVIDSKNVKIIE